jgi:hypothetical protein
MNCRILFRGAPRDSYNPRNQVTSACDKGLPCCGRTWFWHCSCSLVFCRYCKGISSKLAFPRDRPLRFAFVRTDLCRRRILNLCCVYCSTDSLSAPRHRCLGVSPSESHNNSVLYLLISSKTNYKISMSRGGKKSTYTHEITQDETSNLCHLDMNKYSVITITPAIMQREKIYTYIHIDYK